MIFRALRLILLALAIGAAPAQAQEAPQSPRLVIIDDEGFGLMHVMLLQAPDVKVLGLTSVSGNVWANRATAQALRGLETMGRTDVPVMQGATHPLLNSEALTDRWEALYGKLTWKGAWMKQWVEPTAQSTPSYHGPDDPVELSWGQPKTRPAPESAAAFMLRMVRQYPGQVTIIACGPLTNLALAQRVDPHFAGLTKELVVMGGSFNPRQMLDNKSAADFAREFANSPRREFNIRFDPEAASIVARSPWPAFTVVPVDPSTATQFDKRLLARMAQGASPGAATLLSHIEPGFPMWDEIAAGVWLDPGMVTQKERLYVDFDSRFGPGYGDTLSWRAGYQPGLGEQQADVIMAIDPARLEDLAVRLIARR